MVFRSRSSVLLSGREPNPSAPDKARAASLWWVLAALLVLACAGSSLFCWLERDAELRRYELNRAIYRSLTDMVDFEHCHDPAFKDVKFCTEHEELEARLTKFFDRAGNSLQDKRLWTHLGSFLFVVQLGSTIGYEAPPQTVSGQLAAIVFGVAFIPLFGCATVLAARYVVDAAEFLFQFCLGPSGEVELERSRLLRLALILAVVLWPGAALLFMLLEGWSYANALFFCFVTMTTTGFGTDVPATPTSKLLCILYIYVALSAAAGVLERFAGLQSHGEEAPLLPERLCKRLFNPWVCLSLVAVLCLCGAMLFPSLERAEELARYARARRLYDDLNELAHFGGCDEGGLIGGADICRNAGAFRQQLVPFFGPDTPNSMVDREAWTPFGSASFVLALSSTVGYGAHSPHTREGKVAMVVLGVVAIPLYVRYMVLVAASVSTAVERRLAIARGVTRDEVGGKATLALALLVALLWLGGSLVFVVLEAESGWSFAAAMYFCFVTLSGVGFSNVMPHTLAGRVFTQVYIVVGLGLVASLLSELVECLYRVATDPETASREDSPEDTWRSSRRVTWRSPRESPPSTSRSGARCP